MPEARTQIAIRLSEAGLEQIDKIAAAEERTRSQVIRILLREALEARARR